MSAVKRIAVSGASGFIGRHVLRQLLARDVHLVALTRDGGCLREFGDRLDVVEHDMSESAAGLFGRLGRPDVLLHLAWEGLPNYASLHHFETELPRQYAFLRQLVGEGLGALAVTGTCFEYGMKSGPLKEDMPAEPANPYGLAKDTLRRQLECLKAEHGFKFTWARLFYMYGEGQPQNTLWSQFMQSVEAGEAVFNMSGGEQLRDYLPVEAVAGHLIALALAGRDPGVVNICSGSPVSVRRLVEQWVRERRAAIELNLGHYPYPSHEPMAFWGDCAKLKACLEP